MLVGPWNGGLRSPRAFREIMRDDSGWIYHLRVVARLMNLFTGCTRQAARVLSATSTTDRSLPKGSRLERMLENGVDLTLLQANQNLSPPSPTNPLRVLFVGRLIPVKGVSMLLAALEQAKSEIPIHLTIVGDGPLRSSLQEEAERRNLGEVVTFAGAQTLAAVSRYMGDSHLLCLPCVRESGGAVLLEAMACALPVLAVPYGGPAELVDDEVGRLLSAAGPQELIASMIAAFMDAYLHPDEWRRRGQNGRARAESLYGWPARIERTVSLYRRVIEERSCPTNTTRTTPLRTTQLQ